MPDLADMAAKMFSENPCESKAEFLEKVDSLIAVLEAYELELRSNNTICAN
jgi:hypothetical protein